MYHYHGKAALHDDLSMSCRWSVAVIWLVGMLWIVVTAFKIVSLFACWLGYALPGSSDLFGGDRPVTVLVHLHFAGSGSLGAGICIAFMRE